LREVKEELGLDATLGAFVGVYPFERLNQIIVVITCASATGDRSPPTSSRLQRDWDRADQAVASGHRAGLTRLAATRSIRRSRTSTPQMRQSQLRR
jgi:8-oxo-dGTP pyrophosphatase MutT (NUDIX family)